MVHAATNQNVVLQKLSTAAASLTVNNATLMEEIKALAVDNKYFGGLARSVTTAQPGKGKGRWTKETPGRFIVGRYCHTHGYCVGKDNNSSSCRNPGPKHK